MRRVLRTKCPICGWLQNIKAYKVIECRRCGYTYFPRPRRKPSRTAGTMSKEYERSRRMWGSQLA